MKKCYGILLTENLELVILLLHALVRTSWRLDHFYQCSVSLSYKNNSLINCSVAFKQLLQLTYFILGSYFYKQLKVVMKCSPFLLNLRLICIITGEFDKMNLINIVTSQSTTEQVPDKIIHMWSILDGQQALWVFSK